jgi:polyisoprenyl-phosphate glycosyltransferase
VIDLSLVVPCYNEAANLPTLVRRCTEAFDGQNAEIVLVDNGSRDDTPAVLESLLDGLPRIRTTRVPVNQGYGFGILSGLRVARGRVLAWTHADLQTDPEDAIRGLQLFLADSDPDSLFVKGLRRDRPFRDVVFTWGMSVCELLLLRTPMWDINAQPTMFSRTFFESWADPPHDFSLDLYAYYQAVRRGMRVRRFAVRFDRRLSGVGHNDRLAAKLRYSRRTLGYSLELRRRLGATAGL